MISYGTPFPFTFPLNYIEKLKKLGFSNFGKYDACTLSADKDGDLWYFQIEPSNFNINLIEFIGGLNYRVMSCEEFTSQLHPLAKYNPNFRYLKVVNSKCVLVSSEGMYQELISQLVCRKSYYNKIVKILTCFSFF